MWLKQGVSGVCCQKTFLHGKRFTVYGYFRRLSKLGIWEQVLSDLVRLKRLRNEYPSLLIIDAQSVKTAGKGEQRGHYGL